MGDRLGLTGCCCPGVGRAPRSPMVEGGKKKELMGHSDDAEAMAEESP